MDEFHGIGFLGADHTAYTLVPAISAACCRVSIVASHLFVSVSAFTEPVGSG